MPIEIDRGARMVPQDRRGRHSADWAIETSFDSGGFASVRNDGENLLGSQNLAHGHGDGLLGNSVEILEPAFADLLEATRVVQGDDDVGFFRIEIGGRIVERDVPIFADT